VRSTPSASLFITSIDISVRYHMIPHLGSGGGLIIAYDVSSAGQWAPKRVRVLLRMTL